MGSGETAKETSPPRRDLPSRCRRDSSARCWTASAFPPSPFPEPFFRRTSRYTGPSRLSSIPRRPDVPEVCDDIAPTGTLWLARPVGLLALRTCIYQKLWKRSSPPAELAAPHRRARFSLGRARGPRSPLRPLATRSRPSIICCYHLCTSSEPRGGILGRFWGEKRVLRNWHRKQNGPESRGLPGLSAWWPYRDSNPSFSLDHVFACTFK
jgi:hypothetical protein